MDTTPQQPLAGFDSTGLAPAILAALDKAGITTPTPIQAEAVPAAIAGKDVIGIAQTGTGKTLGFALPILQQFTQDPQSTQALILVPTRELAIQVEESIRKVSRFLMPGPRIVTLIGGAPMYRQINDLKGRNTVIVATPGRLKDHVERRTVKLDGIKTLVLDEADRMLDMGFAPQIQHICSLIPKERQTLLFSATFDPAITKLAASLQQDPVRIEVAKAGTSASLIKQEMCYVTADAKPELLRTLLAKHKGSVLVFSRTKHGATKLNHKIQEFGHSSAEIHSNRSLGQRRFALEGFKNGRYRVLVATDVASRGIDVQNISLVINYDLPDASEDYVHRIGRTGRNGADGHAISFATHSQYRDVKAVERLIGRNIALSEHSMPEPAAAYAPRPHHRGPARFNSGVAPSQRTSNRRFFYGGGSGGSSGGNTGSHERSGGGDRRRSGGGAPQRSRSR